MSGYSAKEIREAERLLADAEAQLAENEARTAAATSAAEHMELGRDRASAFGDLKSARFVLTEGESR